MSRENLGTYFRRRFGPIQDDPGESPDLHAFPEFAREFWKEVGFGRREDGFIWLLNPTRFGWLPVLFGRPDLIPFARNSFDEVYFVSTDGVCHQGSANDFNLSATSVDFETTVMNLSRRSATDDEVMYERHQAMWTRGRRINVEQCYCLIPAVPAGGDYETSDLAVGSIKAYFLLLREIQS